MRKTLIAVAGMAVAGCTSVEVDHQYVLGEANAHNIAAQSERDLSVPNPKTVDSISGARAAKAVGVLNSGEAREFREATASGDGNS